MQFKKQFELIHSNYGLAYQYVFHTNKMCIDCMLFVVTTFYSVAKHYTRYLHQLCLCLGWEGFSKDFWLPLYVSYL